MKHQVIQGDCRDTMAVMPDDYVDAVVSDPPYGLSFMGKGWDHAVPGVDFWSEALRVAKPGAHLVAFGGTRTYHRLAVAIEDAGWDLRDCLMWLYGTGFPKSLDVSKAIDKDAGHWRGRAGAVLSKNGAMGGPNYKRSDKGEPITAAAAAWSGWGTALKPAWEPIILARKPLVGTVAENVQEWDTGAINVDGCRVGDAGGTRWPANVLLDEEAAAALDEQAELRTSGSRAAGVRKGGYGGAKGDGGPAIEGSSGGASRFFYVAKAARKERETGCESLPTRPGGANAAGYTEDVAAGNDRNRPVHNHHPTVKPISLMRWLTRLVTPPGGLILDPFTGSGSTGCAAALEGFDFLGCELSPEYVEIAKARIAHWAARGGAV